MKWWTSVLIASALCLAVWPAVARGAVGPLVTVATFDPTKSEAPENIAFDHHGNMYINMALTGEILKIAPDGTQSTFATFKLGTGPTNILLGLAVDSEDNVYAAVASHNAPGSDTHGIWRISPDGTKALFAALDPNGLPNQPMFDARGNLLVSDSFLGTIWKITPSGAVSSWLSDPLLQGASGVCSFPLPAGANGMALYHSDLFVANTSKGLIVRVPVNPDGSAGSPSVYASGCSMLNGADGVSADTKGDLYVAANGNNAVVRVNPTGTIDTLATSADGLDSPSAVVFSPRAGERTSVYIANSAVLSYISNGTPHPSLMRLDVGVMGSAFGNPATATPHLILSGPGVAGSFTVTFPSSAPGQGRVYFGSGPGCVGLVETATRDQGAGTTSRTVNVTGNDLPGTLGDNGIQPGATYYYEVATMTSSGEEINDNGGACFSVTIPTTVTP